MREHRLDDRFRFVPFTPDIAELYRASAVVIAPSQGPEIGRPVLEGAASGVAVIATGTQTGGGIVDPGRTTIVVENVGADVLAEATTELLSDPERRAAIGAAAREHAVRMFDPVANTRRVEAVYESVGEHAHAASPRLRKPNKAASTLARVRDQRNREPARGAGPGARREARAHERAAPPSRP